MYYKYNQKIKLINKYRELIYLCEHNKKYNELLKKSIYSDKSVDKLDTYVHQNILIPLLETIKDVFDHDNYEPLIAAYEIKAIDSCLGMLKYKGFKVFGLELDYPHIYFLKIKVKSLKDKKVKYHSMSVSTIYSDVDNEYLV